MVGDGDLLEEGRKYEAPAQAKLKDEIAEINSKLVRLNEARNLGLGDENVANLTKQIKDLTLKKSSKETSLKRLVRAMECNKKNRDRKKKALQQAIKEFPGLQDSMNVKNIGRDEPGRPPLEETYENLHQDILHIATIGAAASDRRREDLFRSVKTLSDLHHALQEMGYQLSRSALYMRLLPKSASSNEGKRHVRTVPVRYTNIQYLLPNSNGFDYVVDW